MLVEHRPDIEPGRLRPRQREGIDRGAGGVLGAVDAIGVRCEGPDTSGAVRLQRHGSEQFGVAAAATHSSAVDRDGGLAARQ